ncbi:MAG TPA: AmmeMemoRadiSam system protein A [Dissulfurispiraceae bacterium]|nr:AmmeMemoRadiSam system protein A [Dissulfurispiraceae bacterium]
MHPYVALARKAIEEYILHRKVLPSPEEVPDDMKERNGVFVCLKMGNDLRGCIGTFLPTSENLHEEIVKNAVAAATEDPRFHPLLQTELEGLNYSVDVLSAPEPVKDLSELDPKKYGIIVIKGARRGLLLPDLEGVNTVEDQLRITKMKAGIDPGDNNVQIFRFSVERYQ